jgi:Flp pilus assembly protein TadD
MASHGSSHLPSERHAELSRALDRDPDDFQATYAFARLLLEAGGLTEAEVHARNAVRLDPQSARANELLGMILTETHRLRPGEAHYRRALDLSASRDPVTLANLAWNLNLQGRMAEARALYLEAIAEPPEVLQTLLGFARLEEADRDFAAAGRLLDRCERLSPGDSGVALTRAVLQGRQGDFAGAIATLDAVARARWGGRPAPAELLHKGRLLDRLGRYDEAFEAFSRGKALTRRISGRAYLAGEARDQAARLKRFFVAERLALLPRAGLATGPQPIFIVGFPRSGTTLVEQMLSAHPAISAGDELNLIEDVAFATPRMLSSPLAYPEALSDLWMADHRHGLEDLRDHYLRRAAREGAIDPAASWFTDKTPLNETHLGLISLLFPTSPIIQMVRHPLDAVLSSFATQMTHGCYCAYALDTAAAHYALTADLAAHYRAQAPQNLLVVRYEDIIERQEESLRRMLDFIGAPFEPRCLSFERNRRPARTASYAQVTEPLHDRSRYRHRRYARHLQSIVPILRKAMDAHGYQPE